MQEIRKPLTNKTIPRVEDFAPHVQYVCYCDRWLCNIYHNWSHTTKDFDAAVGVGTFETIICDVTPAE